jgi:hypothetical protein
MEIIVYRFTMTVEQHMNKRLCFLFGMCSLSLDH